jgi:hypothetical protein
MPPQQVKSKLVAKLGPRFTKAFDACKDKEVEFSKFGELPQIPQGVALLKECQIREYEDGDNKGKLYWYASGTVLEPTHVGKIKVKGLQTRLSCPLYDTPTRSRKTVEEHVAWVRNQLARLGLNTEGMDAAEFEHAVNTFVPPPDQPPVYFRFSTRKGRKTEIVQENGKWYATDGRQRKGPYVSEEQAKKQNPYAGEEPMTFHEWDGVLEDYEPEEDDETEDDSGEEEGEDVGAAIKASPNGAAKAKPAATPKPAPSPPTRGPTKPTAKKVAPAPEPEPEEPFSEFGDLASLATQANSGDGDAQQALTDMALKAGYTEDDVGGADDWDAVVAMIENPGGGGEASSEGDEDEGEETEEEEGAAEEEGWSPKVDEVYTYAPPLDPKKPSGKRGKAVACIVSAVDEDKKTVSLKGEKNPKVVYKNVPWDKLESAAD